MRAGELRHLVTIEHPTRTPNIVGEQILTFSEVAAVYASVKPLTANETFRARAAGVATTHRVNMRYTSDVKPDSRLTFVNSAGDTVVLNVIGITDVEMRGVELEITGAANG